jgi:CRP-like cAMP-binding protein
MCPVAVGQSTDFRRYLTFPKAIRSSAASRFASRLSDSNSSQAADADALRSLPAFSEFTRTESELLVSLMRRWDLPGAALLFSAGSRGSSCFVVLSGAVTVSMQVDRRQRLLSTFHPGSIFGQIALIEGSPRTATCATAGNTLLLELEQEACKQLFASSSTTGAQIPCGA